MYHPSRKWRGGQYSVDTLNTNTNLYVKTLQEGYVGTFTVKPFTQLPATGPGTAGFFYMLEKVGFPGILDGWPATPTMNFGTVSQDSSTPISSAIQTVFSTVGAPNTVVYIESIRRPTTCAAKYALSLNAVSGLPYTQGINSTILLNGTLRSALSDIPMADESFRVYIRNDATPIGTDGSIYILQNDYAVNRASTLGYQGDSTLFGSSLTGIKQLLSQKKGDLPARSGQESQTRIAKSIYNASYKNTLSTLCSLQYAYSTAVWNYISSASYSSQTQQTISTSIPIVNDRIANAISDIRREEALYSTNYLNYISTLDASTLFGRQIEERAANAAYIQSMQIEDSGAVLGYSTTGTIPRAGSIQFSTMKLSTPTETYIPLYGVPIYGPSFTLNFQTIASGTNGNIYKTGDYAGLLASYGLNTYIPFIYTNAIYRIRLNGAIGQLETAITRSVSLERNKSGTWIPVPAGEIPFTALSTDPKKDVVVQAVTLTPGLFSIFNSTLASYSSISSSVGADDRRIEGVKSTLSGFTTQMDSLAVTRTTEAGNYQSSITEVTLAALERESVSTTLLYGSSIQRYTDAYMKAADTVIMMENLQKVATGLQDGIMMSSILTVSSFSTVQRGGQVSADPLNYTPAPLAQVVRPLTANESALLVSLKTNYQTLSTLFMQYKDNLSKTKTDKDYYETLVDTKDQENIITTMATFDQFIETEIQTYRTQLQNKQTAEQAVSDLQYRWGIKKSQLITSTFVNDSRNSTVTSYTNTVLDYLGKIQAINNDMNSAELAVSRIRTAIDDATAFSTQGANTIQVWNTKMELLRKKINDSLNESTLIVSSLTTSLMSSATIDRSTFINLTAIRSQMLETYDLNVSSMAVYLSSSVLAEFDTYLYRLAYISTSLVEDMVTRLSMNLEYQQQPTDQNRILYNTNLSSINFIQNMQPGIEQFMNLIQGEKFTRNAYVRNKYIYEHQSKLQATPYVENEPTMTADEFDQLKVTYDLLVEQINRSTEYRSSFVNQFHQDFDSIKNYMDTTILTDLVSTIQYDSTNKIYYSTFLPFKMNYNFTPLRQTLFFTTIVPTTTIPDCSAPLPTAGDSTVTRGIPSTAPATVVPATACGKRIRYIEISKENNALEIFQVLAIDALGRNRAFMKTVTVQPTALDSNISGVYKTAIVNGTYNIDAFLQAGSVSGANSICRYFQTPASELPTLGPYEKKVVIDLGDTYDITAIQYIRFPNAYSPKGMRFRLLDAQQNVIDTQTAYLDSISQTLDLRTSDSQNQACAVGLIPKRYGSCGTMARYVRVSVTLPIVAGMNIFMSQIAVVEPNGENLALNKPVAVCIGGTTTYVSLLTDGVCASRIPANCFKADIMSSEDSMMIDLGAEQEITGVHIYNKRDPLTPSFQDKLLVQLMTEDMQIAESAQVRTNFRKEVLDFRVKNAAISCSMELRWPPIYGEAGLLCDSVELFTTKSVLEFSKVEVVDKRGKDVAEFQPVTATVGTSAMPSIAVRAGVSSNRAAMPRSSGVFFTTASYSSTAGKSYKVLLEKVREITAVRVYGLKDEPAILNNVTVNCYNGTNLVYSYTFKGTTVVDEIDTRYNPDDSKFPYTVDPTTSSAKYGYMGVYAERLIYEGTATNLFVVDAAGRNVPYTPTGTPNEYTFGRMYEIVAICYKAPSRLNLKLKDCYGLIVAENSSGGTAIDSMRNPTNLNGPLLTGLVSITFAKPLESGKTVSKVVPKIPFPIQRNASNIGVKARYIRITQRDLTTPLAISQILVVDENGTNAAFERMTYTNNTTPSVFNSTGNVVDGRYEYRPDYSSTKDPIQFTNYVLKKETDSAIFISGVPPASSTNPPAPYYIIVDLGKVVTINSVIYVAVDSPTWKASAEGTVVELIDDAYDATGTTLATVGVGVVSYMTTIFGVDILDFRRDVLENTIPINSRIEVKERRVTIGRRSCGFMAQYIRIVADDPSSKFGISQIIAMDPDGTNVALFKPTYCNIDSFIASTYKVVDGNYYQKAEESQQGFLYVPITGSTVRPYIEVNLTAEFEISQLNVIPLKTTTTQNFTIQIYNASRDLILSRSGTNSSQIQGQSINLGTYTIPSGKVVGVRARDDILTKKYDTGLLPALDVDTLKLVDIDRDPTKVKTDVSGCTTELKADKPFTRTPGGGVPAKRIRVYNLGNYIQISQLMAYTESGVNAAYKKATTASSTLPGFYSDYATDGTGGFFHMPRNESSQSVFISGKGRYEYWEVDLGAVTSIVAIRYIPPATNQRRNIGTRIQLIGGDGAILAEQSITVTGEVILDFRIPDATNRPITEIILPTISSLPTGTSMSGPAGIFYRNGELFVADMNSNKILKYTDTNAAPSIIPTTYGFAAPSACVYLQRSLGTELYYVSNYNTFIIGFGFPANEFSNVLEQSRAVKNPYAILGLGTNLYALENKIGGRLFQFPNGYLMDATAITNPITTVDYGVSITGYYDTALKSDVLFIGSAKDKTIYKFIVAGSVKTEFLSPNSSAQIQMSSLTLPSGLAYDHVQNIMFISDFLVGKVYAILVNRSTNKIVTLAGTGQAGLGGDGRQGIYATFDGPFGLAYAADLGVLFISDYNNSRIRKIDLNMAPPKQVLTTTTLTPLFQTTTTRDPTDTATADMINLNSIPTEDIYTVTDVITPSTVRTSYNSSSTILSFCYDTINNIIYTYEDTGTFYKLPQNSSIITPFTINGITSADTCFMYFDSVNNRILISINTQHKIIEVPISVTGDMVTNSSRTLAGTGTAGYDTNTGTPAVNRPIRSPTYITIDSYGQIYFTEAGNKLIRKITRSGMLETAVGFIYTSASTVGSENDGLYVDPRACKLQSPAGIVADSNNNIFICDRLANRIYCLTYDGKIMNVAGFKPNTFTGNLRFIHTLTDGSVKVLNRLGTQATPIYYVESPGGITVDSQGSIYVTSYTKHQIVKISNPLSLLDSTSSTVPSSKIQIFAGIGNGAAGRTVQVVTGKAISYEYPTLYTPMKGPSTLYYNQFTNQFFYLDLGNNRIQCIFPDEVEIYSKGINGIIPYAPISIVGNTKRQITWDHTGSIAISEAINATCIAADSRGNIYYGVESPSMLSIIRPSGTKETLPLSLPYQIKGLAIYNETLLFGIFESTDLSTSTPSGQLFAINIYDPSTILSYQSGLSQPQSICIHPNGAVFVGCKRTILRVDATATNTPTVIYNDQTSNADIFFTSLCLDTAENLYAATNGIIYKFTGVLTSTPSVTRTIVYTFTNIPANTLLSLAFTDRDPSYIYASLSSTGSVYKIPTATANGSSSPPYTPILAAGTGTPAAYIENVYSVACPLSNPQSIVFNSRGELLIADKRSRSDIAILKLTSRQFMIDRYIYGIIGFGQTSSSFTRTVDNLVRSISNSAALGVAFDSIGNIYTAEGTLGGNIIRKVDMLTGNVATLNLGTGITLANPSDVKVSPGGTVYIADTGNNRILRSVLQIDGSYSTRILTTAVPSPRALYLDPYGNCYCVGGDGTIVRIDQFSITSTVVNASTSKTSTFSVTNVKSVAADVYGNLFILSGNALFTINLFVANPFVTLLAGSASEAAYAEADGVGSAVRFNSPSSIAIDSQQNLYVADTGNNRIRKISISYSPPNPTFIRSDTVVGTGTPEFAKGVANLAGLSGDGGLAINANITAPNYITIDSRNRLLFSQATNYRVRIVPLTLTTNCAMPVKSIQIVSSYAGKRINFASIDVFNMNNQSLLSNPATYTLKSTTMPASITNFLSDINDKAPSYEIIFSSETQVSYMKLVGTTSDIGQNLLGAYIRLKDARGQVLALRSVTNQVLQPDGEKYVFIPKWSVPICSSLPIELSSSPCGIAGVRYVKIVNSEGIMRLTASQVVILDTKGQNIALGLTENKSTTYDTNMNPLLGKYTGTDTLGVDMITDGALLKTNTGYQSLTTATSEYILFDLGEIPREIMAVLYYPILGNERTVGATTQVRLSIQLLDTNRKLLNEKQIRTLQAQFPYEMADFRMGAADTGCMKYGDLLKTVRYQSPEVFIVYPPDTANLVTKANGIVLANRLGLRLASFAEAEEAVALGGHWRGTYYGWIRDRDSAISLGNSTATRYGILISTQATAGIVCFGARPPTNAQNQFTLGGKVYEVISFTDTRKGSYTPLTDAYVRYVRVEPANIGSPLQLSKVSVLSLETGEDLALNKRTNASSNLATSGTPIQSPPTQFTSATGDTDAWWEVDLETEFPIEMVQIVSGQQINEYKVTGYTETRLPIPLSNSPESPRTLIPLSVFNLAGGFYTFIGITRPSSEAQLNISTTGIDIATRAGANKDIVGSLVITNFTFTAGNTYTLQLTASCPRDGIQIGIARDINGVYTYYDKFYLNSNTQSFQTTFVFVPLNTTIEVHILYNGPSTQGISMTISSFKLYEHTNTIVKSYTDKPPTLGTSRVRYLRVNINNTEWMNFRGFQVLDIHGIDVAKNKTISNATGPAGFEWQSGYPIQQQFLNTVFKINLYNVSSTSEGNIMMINDYSKLLSLLGAGSGRWIYFKGTETGSITSLANSQLTTYNYTLYRLRLNYNGPGSINATAGGHGIHNINVQLLTSTGWQAATNLPQYNSTNPTLVDIYISNIQYIGPEINPPYPAQGFHANTQGESTWELDLGQEYEIKSILYHNRFDCCQYRSLYQSILAMDTYRNPVTVKPFFGGLLREVIDFRRKAGISRVRKIRVETTGASQLKLVQLMFFDINGNNVTMGRQRTYSPMAAGAVDTCLNGSYDIVSASAYISSTSGPGLFYEVDLGKDFEIVSGVVITPTAEATPIPYQVKLLDANGVVLRSASFKLGTLWREVFDFTDPQTPAISPYSSRRILTDSVLSGCVTARYVRIMNPFRVFSNDTTTQQPIQQPTLQPHTAFNTFTLNTFKLRDIYNREIQVGKYMYSQDRVAKTSISFDNGYGSWIEFDLGKQYPIYSIEWKVNDDNFFPVIPVFFYSNQRSLVKQVELESSKDTNAYMASTYDTNIKRFVLSQYSKTTTLSQIPSGPSYSAQYVRIESENQFQIRQIVVIDDRGINIAVGKRMFSGEPACVNAIRDIHNLLIPGRTTTGTPYSDWISKRNDTKKPYYAVDGLMLKEVNVTDKIQATNTPSPTITPDSSRTTPSMPDDTKFWMELDLGKTYSIKTVYIYNGTDNGISKGNVKLMDSTRNYVSSFESNQNNSVQMYPNPTTSTSTSTVPLITTEKGKLARYVRLLNGTKYNHVILSRLVVVDVLGRQVSINKKVYASSGGTGSVVTQYDNIDDTNTGHHSSGSPGDYLEIDLGEEYYIAYVCFYNVHWYYSAFTADGLNVQLLDASRRLTGTKQLTNQSTVPRLDMGTYIGPTGGYYYKELTGVTPILPTASSCQSGQLDTGDGRCYTTCADGGYTLENPSSDTFCLKNCNSNEDKSWDNLRCIPRCLPGYDPNGESQCIQNCANVNFGMGQANGQDPAGNPLEVMAENSLRCRTVPSPNSVMRWEIWSDWRNNYFPIGSWSRSRGFDPNGLVYTGGWVSWWGDKIWWVPTDTDLGETNRFRLDWPDVKEWAQQNERETVRKPLLRKSPSEGGQGLTSFPPDTNPIMGINQYRVTDLLLNGSRRIRRVYEIARGIQNRTVITRQTGPRTIVNKTGGIYATPTNVVATTNISHIKHTNYNVYLPRFINTHLIMVMGMKTTTESNRTQIISRERKYVYNGIPLFEVLDFTDDVPNTQLSTTSNQSVSYILEEVV